MELYEEIVIETQANQITPLVVNPGRVVLSTSRLYFQPYNNVSAVSPTCNTLKNLLETLNFSIQY